MDSNGSQTLTGHQSSVLVTLTWSEHRALKILPLTFNYILLKTLISTDCLTLASYLAVANLVISNIDVKTYNQDAKDVGKIINLLKHTCRLHTGTFYGHIAESGPPFSIHIYIHTRFVPAWFKFSPAGIVQMPTINIFKITSSLKINMDQMLSNQ